MKIKQFGLQRTGTNAIVRLLEANYDVQVATNIGGWKHGVYRRDIMHRTYGGDLDCIVCIRSPLAWISSMFRYRPKGETLAQHVAKDHHAAIWSTYYRSFMRLKIPDRRIVFVRFEDLILNPLQTTRNTVKALGLAPEIKGGTFEFCETRIDSGDRDTGVKYDPGWHLRQGHLSEYNEAMLEQIRMRLDWQVVEHFNYGSKVRGEVT